MLLYWGNKCGYGQFMNIYFCVYVNSLCPIFSVVLCAVWHRGFKDLACEDCNSLIRSLEIVQHAELLRNVLEFAFPVDRAIILTKPL